MGRCRSSATVCHTLPSSWGSHWVKVGETWSYFAADPRSGCYSHCSPNHTSARLAAVIFLDCSSQLSRMTRACQSCLKWEVPRDTKVLFVSCSQTGISRQVSALAAMPSDAERQTLGRADEELDPLQLTGGRSNQHLPEKPQVCVAGKLFLAASLGFLAGATVAALGQSQRKPPPSGADEERPGASVLARPRPRPRSPLESKSKAGNATRVRRGNRTANLATSSAPPWGFGTEKKATSTSRPSQSTTTVTTRPFVFVRSRQHTLVGLLLRNLN